MKFDINKLLNYKVITKSGYSVRILCTDRVSEIVGPIVALVKTSPTEEILVTYYSNGKCCLSNDSNLDLSLIDK